MNKLIAVVGMSGVGKSVVTEYLESIGWKKLYFGGITYKLMEQEGIERDKDGKVEKEFREKLRKEHGPECYAKFLDPEIKETLKENNVVLDGLYSWYEYTYLIERYPELKLVCVVADKELRYSRVAVRPDRPFDRDAIVYRDISEIENLYKGGPIAYADYYILNNSDKENVINRTDEIIKEIGD
ncbi:MAG: AAA family ATPase [Bacilli bacterium]|nr:AAA family ATPase [Bacilli bacterium]